MTDQTPTISVCISAASAAFHVAPDAIKGRGTRGEFVRPRQAVCWLARHTTGRSFASIGRIMNLHHTTVIYACETVDNLRERHPGFARQLNSALNMVLNPGQEELAL